MDLRQFYRSVDDHPDVVETLAKGKIPPWLRGSYYKIGNGKFDLPGGFTFNHVFDGYAIIYHYDIAQGKVKYRSRYLESDAYIRGMAAGKPVYTEFGTRSFPDPHKSLFGRTFSSLVPGDLTDNNCSNIVQLRGKLWTTSETCFIHQLNKETLATMSKADFNKIVGVNLTASHYLEDCDGTTYNIATSFTSGLKYQVIKFPPLQNGRRRAAETDPLIGGEIVASISSRWKTCFSFIHSFGMSEKYVILIEQPFVANTLKLLASQIQGKSLSECLVWQPAEKTRFILIKKSPIKVLLTKYLGPSFFFCHVINSYEEDGHVVFDVISYPSPYVLEKLLLSKLRNNELDQAELQCVHRYVLPIIENLKDVTSSANLVRLQGTTAKAEKVSDDAIMCTPETIGEPGLELPSINFSKCGGKKYRYVYGTGLYTNGRYKRAVGKLNMETKETTVWKGEESQCLSEPRFVANPSGTAEDDGVIITTILDSRKENSHTLLIIDAKSFTELGRFEIPHRGIVGNHSLFLPS